MVADDHRVFREGIVSILENTKEIKVIAQAQDGKEVMEKLHRDTLLTTEAKAIHLRLRDRESRQEEGTKKGPLGGAR